MSEHDNSNEHSQATDSSIIEQIDTRIADYTRQLRTWTAVLSVATVFLGIATGGLWWYASEQAHDVKESIAQAREANRIALDALGSDRAWVGMDSFTSSPVVEDQDCRISILVGNYGRTPAFDYRGVFRATINEKGVNILFDAEIDKSLPGTVLFPGQKSPFEMVVPKELISKSIAKTKSGEEAFVVIGLLQYRTGALPARKTRIFLRYDPSASRFLYTQAGNDAD